jgi:hypothetical protein
MTFRTFLTELLVIVAVLLVSASVAELLLRWALFHGDAFERWRVPEWYTQTVHVNDHIPSNDDRDKLSVRWGRTSVDTTHYHAELGWYGDLDPQTLLPGNYNFNDRRADVVLLGRGWRDADGQPHHPIIENDSLREHRYQFVDLSVAGFAPDQDMMLARRTMPLLDHALLCIAVDPHDLDLTMSEFHGRPKPWFEITPQGLRQMGVPVEKTDPEEGTGLRTNNGSFLFHLVANRLFGDSVASISAVRAREEGLRWLSMHIFSTLLDSSRVYDAFPVVFVDDRVDGWMLRERVDRIAERCGMAGVPYRLLSELLFEQGTENVHDAMDHEVVNWATVPEYGQRVYEWNKVRALIYKKDEELNEVDLRIKGILIDENWMKEERRKAKERGVGVSVILLEDARYTLELDKKKQQQP